MHKFLKTHLHQLIQYIIVLQICMQLFGLQGPSTKGGLVGEISLATNSK